MYTVKVFLTTGDYVVVDMPLKDGMFPLTHLPADDTLQLGDTSKLYLIPMRNVLYVKVAEKKED